jgi:Asp-tRNA(Asn)/Glu-tRNA(Gln) amidotransferase A subunit family amidase
MEAVQIAADLDERYSKNEQKKPPLYGLPFSVKESIFVRFIVLVIMCRSSCRYLDTTPPAAMLQT